MTPKALAELLYDAFNRNDFDAVMAATASDVEIVNVAWNTTYRGHDGFRTFLQGWKTMAPDCTVEIVRQLASPDGVANECVFHGTHTGLLQTPTGDIPATGRHVDAPFCEVWRVRAGKLASLHNYGDSVTMMTQLGLMPAPA
jgi:steroid delta-isomerase-like uncharacterized protein